MMEKIYNAIEPKIDETFLLSVTKLMQEEGGLVKMLATRLLATIGEESTIPLLRELLDDGNVNIRTTAENTVRAIRERVKAKKEAEAEEKKGDEENE
jgi:HEAT repeat protein